MPFVKNEMCIGCGICVQECPSGAIRMADGVALIDQAKCTKCGKCVDVCPQQAIRPNSENVQLRDVSGGVRGHKGGSGRRGTGGLGLHRGGGMGGGRCGR